MMAIQTTLAMKHGGCYKVSYHWVAASGKDGNFVSVPNDFENRKSIPSDVNQGSIATYTCNPENIEILYREHDCKCVVMPRIAIQNDLLL